MGAAAIVLGLVVVACFIVIGIAGARAVRYPEGDARRNLPRYVYPALVSVVVGLFAIIALLVIAAIAIAQTFTL